MDKTGTSESFEVYAYINVFAEPAESGEVPFSVLFRVEPVGIVVDAYYLDIHGDELIDRMSLDGEFAQTFDVEGTYVVRFLALDFEGRLFEKSLEIQALPAVANTDAMTFCPHYPESDSVASTVMKGGKVVRWYRVRDANSDPVVERTIRYRMLADGIVLDDFQGSISKDDQGFAGVETPYVLENAHFDLVVIDDDGNDVEEGVFDPPSFDVHVADRESTTTYTFLIGMGGSVGTGGPSGKLGPVKFKTAYLGLEVGRNVSTDIVIETVGSDSDLVMENTSEDRVGFEATAGISGGVFKEYINLKGRPSIENGVGADACFGNAMSAQYRFEDFFDENRNDHNLQLRTAAALFLENCVKLFPMAENNILVRKALDNSI